MSTSNTSGASESDIAVVGLAGRFPGAANPDQFWANLRDGVESSTPLTDEQLLAAGVDPALVADPDYVKVGYVLDGMEQFDAGFFGFSPRDAAIMDPQHRHFLECAWEAMEHAGHAPGRFDGQVGVFAGSGANTYFMFNLLTNPELVKQVGFFLLRHTGNDKDFLATRVSYQMNLSGPSVNVQTACSTSLVAIHQACQSLLSGECDMALAGGATVKQPHHVGYLYKEGEILSPDGHCRAFDAASEGTVFGSGVGVVVLRRLVDALRDGDTVHAVIKGSAINNDGSMKVGYLAPSVDGQAKVISEALAIAGVEPESIGYVEAHGTGTPVGDPIEIAALTEAFRGDTEATQFCALGSLKTNVGHLDTAAGVAGLIKVVQALKHRQLPPTLHFSEPNPACGFEDSPFFVQSELADWKAGDEPRRAGVSSLGAGGTNAHVVLEEAPAAAPSGPSREWQLLVTSAKSATAAERAGANLAEHLRANPDASLADAAYTLQVGREAFAHRRAVVARDGEDAAAALEDARRVVSGTAGEAERPVTFMFAGGGAQYPDMGAGLYRTEPVFRDEVDRCLAILRSKVGIDLKPVLFPGEAGSRELERPSLALPALFTVQYALAKLWMSWGVSPSAMIGHSMGEYTAAHLAGVFSLEDALSLVSVRGRLFEQVPEGGMLSVPLPVEELRPLLGAELSVAAVNAPSLCAASGPVHAIDALERALAADDVECHRVRISIAAHSAMLDPILPEFGRFVRGIQLHAPTLPFISNVSGTWITAAEATDPEYWVRHLRGTVRFSEGMEELLKDAERLLLEVGPGRTLATLAKQQPAAVPARIATSLRHPDEPVDDAAFLLTSLGRLWAHGAAVDWSAFYGDENRRRVPLPTYAWDHQRYWTAPGKPAAAPREEGVPRKRADVGQWFYQPSWKRTVAPPRAARTGPVLLFADAVGMGAELAASLASAGRPVVRVDAGDRFARVAPAHFVIDPNAPEHFVAVLSELGASGLLPTDIVHLWTVAGEDVAPELSFYSLLFLAQAMGAEDWSHPLRLTVVSSNMQQVAGETALHPHKALLLGPTKVAASEFPNVESRSVDVVLPPAGTRQMRALSDRLLRELDGDPADEVVALRGADRWAQNFEAVRLEGGDRGWIREEGVYLVTGGLGGIALEVAEELARTARARLVLVGRSPLPPRGEWSAWLASHVADDATSRRIRRVQRLEELGGEVMVAGADVTDARAMRGVVDEARARFGALHGVIHAAGVLDDGLIQGKSPETAARVLAPKVAGTMALDEALEGVDLDFFIAFSSRGSITGVAGQVDYAAANAFLDAFAQRKAAHDGIPAVSINWSAWQEVGMTARATGTSAAPLSHPVFTERYTGAGGEEVFSARMSAGGHWLLGEHRISTGEALIPGTGYLELARAAWREQPGAGDVELRDVLFLSPFMVHGDEEKELRLVLRRDTGQFTIAGPVATDEGEAWQEHVRGTLASRPAAQPAPESLAELIGRCSARRQEFSGQEQRRKQLILGPRWANLKRVDFGAGEAVARLELPADFAEDVGRFGLHPALLDVATACAQSLIPQQEVRDDFYVPASYGSVRVRGDLPRTLYSHIRLQPGDEGGDLAVFDVTLLDDTGAELVSISEFTMMRVAQAGITEGGERRRLVEMPARAAAKAPAGADEGILPAEGIEAFRRIVRGDAPPQVIVSPQDLVRWMEHLRAPEPAPEAAAAPAGVDVTETEALLNAHEAISQAAVMARRDSRQGSTRITAYLVYEPGESLTASELRRHLRGRVDDDQVPQHFVELDELPLKPTGEIDRAALPDPFGDADDHVAPRTPMEQAIADVWQELLGTDRVSVHDNFLDVGGHSLLAMRAISRIAKKTGVRLSPSALNLQTLEQIAAECEAGATPPAAEAPQPAPAEPAGGLRQRLMSAVRQTVARV